eukprot:4153265-Pyramimonas_sp.AAC.1
MHELIGTGLAATGSAYDCACATCFDVSASAREGVWVRGAEIGHARVRRAADGVSASARM